MSTPRVTIELSEEDFGLLRKQVDFDNYASESQVLAELIPELLLERAEDPAYERWIEEAVLPAYDEAEAHPESLLTEEQLLQCLEERRKLRRQRPSAA